MENEGQKLFSLHGELGYFSLFDGQMKISLLIIGPRGFGKSELFSLFIKQFNDEYVKFVPVASDAILFQQYNRRNEIFFFSKGKDVSIRGKNGLDWERKIPIATIFDKNFHISLNEFRYGILIVGALGIGRKSRKEYQEIAKKRGHKVNNISTIRLLRIEDPDDYLFRLIQEMIAYPSYWKQLELFREGKLAKIEEEFRLIKKISEYFPRRILELSLPVAENKWGQLDDVFKALVLKMDRMIISTVEFKLNRMIKQKMIDLIDQIQHEWKFPEDKQLPDLSGVPEIMGIKQWLNNKIEKHGNELDLPPKIKESLVLGLLSIQTAFVEKLSSILKLGVESISAEQLKNQLTIHSIAIDELIEGLVTKPISDPDIRKAIQDTKKEMHLHKKFLNDVMKGKI